MSKIFYDHLIILEEVDTQIKNIAESPEEKEELWKLVDDIVHHKVMISILDKLPLEHHDEFLTGFHKEPHSEKHIHFINSVIEGNIEDVINEEIKNLETELLDEIRALKAK